MFYRPSQELLPRPATELRRQGRPPFSENPDDWPCSFSLPCATDTIRKCKAFHIKGSNSRRTGILYAKIGGGRLYAPRIERVSFVAVRQSNSAPRRRWRDLLQCERE